MVNDYPEKQFGFRFYDSRVPIGPLTRDQVLAKLRDDTATIPLERHYLGDGRWSPWTESNELMLEVTIPTPTVPAQEALA